MSTRKPAECDLLVRFLAARDTLTDEDWTTFIQWLQDDPERVRALKEELLVQEYLGQELTVERADFTAQLRQRLHDEDTPPRMITPLRSSQSAKRRWLVRAAGLVLLLGLAAVLVLQRGGWQRPSPTRIAAAETETVQLEDGTSLTLSSDADWHLEQGPSGKRLTLRAGRVTADVAPQPPDAPMVVALRRGRITVVGTRLDVYATEQADWIGLLEGRVQVSPKEGGAVDMQGGDALLLHEGGAESAKLGPGGTWSFPVEVHATVDRWRAARTSGGLQALYTSGGADGRTAYVQAHLPPGGRNPRLFLHLLSGTGPAELRATTADVIAETHIKIDQAPPVKGPPLALRFRKPGWAEIPLPEHVPGGNTVLCLTSESPLRFASRESNWPPTLAVQPPGIPAGDGRNQQGEEEMRQFVALATMLTSAVSALANPVVPGTPDASQFFRDTLPEHGVRVHTLGAQHNLLIPPEQRYVAAEPEVIVEAVADTNGLSVWRNDAEDAFVLYPKHIEITPSPAIIKQYLASDDQDARRQVAWAAGWVPTPEIVGPLLGAATHDDAETARLALKSIQRLGWAPVLAMQDAAWPLAQSIADGDWSAGPAEVVRAAGQAGGDKAVAFLLPRLETEETARRLAVIRALGDSRDPRALQPLVELGEKTPDARATVAGALGQLGRDEAVPVLLEWHEGAGARLQQQIQQALAAIGTDEAVAFLEQRLQTEKRYRLMRLIAMLGNAQSDKAEAVLRRLLDDEDDAVAGAARCALIKRGVEDAPAILKKAFADPKRGGAQAGHAVASGGDEMLRVLTGALQSEHRVVSYSAAVGLGRVGGDAAAEAIIAAMDGSAGARARIDAQALSLTGSDKVVSVLPKIMQSGRFRAGPNVRLILRALPPEKALSVIKEQLNTADQSSASAYGSLLLRLPVPGALAEARRLYDNGDVRVKTAMLRTAAQVNGPFALELAKSELDQDQSQSLARTVQILSAIGGPEAVGRLRELEQNTEDPRMREMIQRQLSRLTGETR